MTSRKPAAGTGPNPRTETMRKGRQADSARRRKRVLTALDHAAASGTEISASGIARAAGVDRTFLYRHRDLLEKIHGFPKRSANKRGASPGSARPPTSTRSTRKSPISSRKPPTCGCNSKNAATNSQPPAPPTAS
jgi:hypothetical protein